MTTKRCRKCHETKPSDAFSPQQRVCRACRARAALKYRAWLRARTKIELPVTKTCFNCKQTRPAADFVRNRNAVDGLDFRCRPCTWRRLRVAALQRKYKLSEADWMALYTGNFGRCHSCDRVFVAHKKPHVDHEHESGRVRGLVCDTCNRTVGNHSVEYIVACAVYVARSKVGERPLGLEKKD